MKKAWLSVMLVTLAVAAHAREVVAQDASGAELKTVTLFGSIKRSHDTSRALYSFKSAAFERLEWDLSYGLLYVNEDHDWFQVSTAKGVRTAVRDLGAHKWTDSFKVPVVEPFPLLKPGEQRVIKVDVSGKDGEDGAPGANGAHGADAAMGPPLPAVGVSDTPGTHLPSSPRAPSPPRRPKHDGVPKVDPIFVKAVPGHVYVMRVVDEDDDFYVLFRVESLVRGDNCTISWKRVPTPRAASVLKR